MKFIEFNFIYCTVIQIESTVIDKYTFNKNHVDNLIWAAKYNHNVLYQRRKLFRQTHLERIFYHND